MKPIVLDFLCKYAEIHGMKEMSFPEVVEYAIDFLNSDDYMMAFVIQYDEVAKYNLLDEVKAAVASGDNFWAACGDWDILVEF